MTLPTPVAGALALDPGSVRVGLAAADPSGRLATPVAVLDARRVEELWARVAAEARSRGSRVVIVGLPLQMDGREGEAAARARQLADDAGRRTGLRVEFWDERLSSVEAERSLIAQGMRRDRRRRTADAVAAAIVLQSWLDWRRLRAAGGGPA